MAAREQMDPDDRGFAGHPQYRNVIARWDNNENAYAIIGHISEELQNQLPLMADMTRPQARAAAERWRITARTSMSNAQLLAFCEYSVKRLP